MLALSSASHRERRCHERLSAALVGVPQQGMCRVAESGVFSTCASVPPIVSVVVPAACLERASRLRSSGGTGVL